MSEMGTGLVTEDAHPPARSIFRSMLEGTGVYSILMIAQRLISLALLPIATRYLTRADYGVIGLLDNTNIIFSLLLGSQVSAAFGFFYFEKGSGKTSSQVVGTTFGGSLMLGILAGGLGWAMSGPLGRLVFAQDGFQTLLRISFVTLGVGFLGEAAFSWLRVEERLRVYVVASLSRIVLAFVGVIALVALLHRGVWGMMVSNLAVTLVLTIALIVYAFAAIRLEFDWGLLKRMLRFSAPVSLSAVAMFFIHYGDSFVLRHYATLDVVGIYGMAYKIGMAVSIIQGSFLTYWNSQVFKIIQREDARAIFARVFTYMTLALAFSAMGLVLFSRPALIVLTAPIFHGAAAITPLIVLAYFLRSFAEFWRSVFYATNHPGLDAICILISLAVCTTGYFLLIPRWGMWWAGTATAICFTFMVLLTGLWAHRLWPYYLETLRLVKIMLSAAVLVGVHFLIPVGSLWNQILWSVLLTVLFPALLLALRFLTPAEWKMMGVAWDRVRQGVLPWQRS